MFSRSASLEATYKFPLKNRKGNTLLFDSFNGTILKKIQKTKIPYFHFDEFKQIGSNFGERLWNAMQSVYSQGFEKVIVVGNDCPKLTSNQLIKVAGLLQDNKTVLGPNYNGGLYLIGLEKNVFQKEDFLELKWQSSALFSNFLNLCIQKPLILKKHIDINTKDDIIRLLSINSISTQLKIIFKTFIFKLFEKFRFSQNIKINDFIQFSFNKGSPLSI